MFFSTVASSRWLNHTDNKLNYSWLHGRGLKLTLQFITQVCYIAKSPELS